MAKFCFVVVDSSGNSRTGSMEVANEEEALSFLAANNLTVKDLFEQESGNTAMLQPDASGNKTHLFAITDMTEQVPACREESCVKSDEINGKNFKNKHEKKLHIFTDRVAETFLFMFASPYSLIIFLIMVLIILCIYVLL